MAFSHVYILWVQVNGIAWIKDHEREHMRARSNMELRGVRPTYNTRHVKSFCSNCGSTIPSIQNEGKLIVVPAGSVDVPIEIKPNAIYSLGVEQAERMV